MCDLETSRMGAAYIYDISRLRVKHSTLGVPTGRKVHWIALPPSPPDGLESCPFCTAERQGDFFVPGYFFFFRFRFSFYIPKEFRFYFPLLLSILNVPGSNSVQTFPQAMSISDSEFRKDWCSEPHT